VEQLTANKMLSNSVRGQELADESHTETLNRQVNQAGTGAPPRPSLTLAQLQDIQSECMADDIEIDLAKMAFWTAEEAVAYFESGGEVEPPPKPTPPPEPAPPEPAPPDPVPAAPSEPETPPEAEPPPEPEPAPRLVKKWSSAFFFSEEAAVRREALAAERLTSGEGEASLPANGGGGVFQMPDSGAAEEDEELTVEEGVAAFSAAILESARLVPDAELVSEMGEHICDMEDMEARNRVMWRHASTDATPTHLTCATLRHLNIEGTRTRLFVML